MIDFHRSIYGQSYIIYGKRALLLLPATRVAFYNLLCYTISNQLFAEMLFEQ